jgi:hypothetical protein
MRGVPWLYWELGFDVELFVKSGRFKFKSLGWTV